MSLRQRYDRRRDAKMNQTEVRAAHELHFQADMSVLTISRKVWKRYGYASAKACSNALYQAFRLYGLAINGAAATPRPHGEPDGRSEWERRKGQLQPKCAGVRLRYPRKGQPCRLYAMRGSDYCHQHDPARRDQVVLHAAHAREGISA